MRRVRDRVVASIREHELWSAGDAVCVGVSGGRDSMVLLDILCATQGLHGGRLAVVSVDHGTRPDSAAHAAFVNAHCSDKGIDCTVVTLNLGRDASEATCRQARREALFAAGGDVVCLAHHERDQAETLLIRLLRGTSPRGLRGMSWRSHSVVRPMLGIPYGDVVAYAQSCAVPFVHDTSNDSDRFLRNRVRSELLPLLEDLRSGSTQTVARTASQAAEQAEWLDALAAEHAPNIWACGFLAEAPVALVRRAVLMVEPTLEHKHVDGLRRLAKRGRGTLQLPNGRKAIAEAGRVRTCPGVKPSAQTGNGGACDT